MGHGVPDRLERRLGLADAVVIGLGSMLGAGVFAAVGPAAGAAGSWLLAGLVLAGLVAYANASSSAALAAVYPESGGAYVYGRRRLGPFWGFLAGWAFVAGKLASCAAMALTFGSYVAPGLARPVALGGLAAVTVANYLGVARTAAATRVVVAVVLAALAAAVAGMLLGGRADLGNLTSAGAWPGGHGVLQAAGLLFFAFAGYARVATLGEEVADPARTIPRAVPLAPGIVLVVYAVVAAAALLAVGPAALAASAAPLADAVAAGRLAGLEPVVRVGAAVASLGVLLSLQAGGLLFFAFAGYARVATLGEEVVDPARTIPRAVRLALGIVLAIYAVVCAAALLAVGPAALAAAAAPLADAVAAGRLAGLEPVVRVGAAVASLGVLLSLQAGLSRTGFAMASNRDLPGVLAAVHPRYRVPHRAELAVAGLVAVALVAVDLRGAIGFSSTLVLVYYAVANAAAWTLGPAGGRWPRWRAGAGLAGCLLLAASLPVTSVLAGAAVLGLGSAVWAVRPARDQPL